MNHSKKTNKQSGNNPKSDDCTDSDDQYQPQAKKRKSTRSKAHGRMSDKEIMYSTLEDIYKILPFITSNNNNPTDTDQRSDNNKIKKLITKVKHSKLDKSIKKMCLDKLNNCGSDDQKLIEWVESILKLPFNKYANLPITINNSQQDIYNYFQQVQDVLDEAVYGLETVKEEIINFIAQFISTNNISSPRIIGLCSEPGCGKTNLIKNGLSKALKRPMKLMSMGGVRDASHFTGFDYTYSGSRYGCIAQALIESEIMNPIIFMDELDKISNTTEGMDVQNLLIHLTDPIQNMKFQDKYFSGIDIDVSKVIFIFSFNDVHKINPILKDRIHIINLASPNDSTKVIIGQKYLVKELIHNIGFNLDDLIFSQEIIKYIISQYCQNDKGVRNLKRCIETIMLKINTARFIGDKTKYKSLKNIKLPLTITTNIVEDLIVKEYDERDEFIRSMFC